MNKPNDGPRWAVITPDGKLTWYRSAQDSEVERIIAGAMPGALARSMVVYKPREVCLRLLASDVALLFPDRFPANPVAERVLAVLSEGHLAQHWRGAVAITQYGMDDVTGEVLWPDLIEQAWAERITAAHREASSCPYCRGTGLITCVDVSGESAYETACPECHSSIGTDAGPGAGF